MTLAAFFDLSFLATLPGCRVEPAVMDCHGTVIGDDTPVPIPDYHVLWPGKPTTNTIWTAVEDYTWFEAFSEEGCATSSPSTPAPHMQTRRKENTP